MTMSNGINAQFGDTSMTKVFVGGLAWETPKEALREHFQKYGEILEAVIISDKLTGRSKGYGFVTFKEPEAARKACEDPTPVVNGRRANCNLASLGARRQRSFAATSPQQGANSKGGSMMTTSAAAANPVQWYYPAAAAPPTGTPYPHQQLPHHHQAFPFYGYNPTYIAPELTYNPKASYMGGRYMNGQLAEMYSGGGQGVAGGNALMPVYHFYAYNNHHTTNSMALPAPHHLFPSSTITPFPAVISSPVSIAPPPNATGGRAGAGGDGIKKV